MHLRIARHTKDLQPVIDFYHGILGLEVLGQFDGHGKYCGIFLGLKNSNWHLEFTTSDKAPNHLPDKDDLLVFYSASEMEYEEIIKKFLAKGIMEVSPENPYWMENSKTYEDPDGFLIVISKMKKFKMLDVYTGKL